MKANITFFLFLCLVIPMVSASDYIGHKQNTPFTLIFQSNNATLCNFTGIQYPDGTSSIFNLPMSKSGTEFSITISAGNFSRLGDTCMFGRCTDGFTYETGSVCRNVTPSGFTSTVGFYFIFIAIIVLIFVMGVALRNTWIMTLGSILVLILGFFIIINGIDVIKDSRTTWAVGIVIWTLGIYFMYLSVEEQLKEWR